MASPFPNGATERTIDAGGRRLAVTELGSGPPLIALHGTGSRAASWLPISAELAAGYRLLLPDLRGHGASEKPDAGYGIEDYAGDLEGLIDALQLDEVRLLGHSLGGLAVLTWATRHPYRAARIALEDVPLRSAPDTSQRLDGWAALAAMTPEQAAAYYHREHPDWSDDECRRRAVSITSTHPAVFTELKARSLEDDGRVRIDGLSSIASPTLLIHGDVDAGGMVSRADADRFAETLPNAAVARLPGGGHSLHREQSNAFLALLMPFLA